MKHFVMATAIAAWLSAPGCEETSPRSASPQTRPDPAPIPRLSSFPPSRAGAEAMLNEFVKPGANYVALSRQLRPRPADYAVVFRTKEFAKKAERTYEKLWNRIQQHPIRPRDGQTKLIVHTAQVREILSDPKLGQIFPKEYRRVGHLLNPNLVMCSFRFMNPATGNLLASDGLYNIDGRWVFMPKPWRILDQ